jgi:amino acid transporter
MLFQDVAQLLASSRFLWALARDTALPFSPYLKMLSKDRIPILAVWVMITISLVGCVLSSVKQALISNLITDGYAMTSLTAYLLPIGIYLCCDKV